MVGKFAIARLRTIARSPREFAHPTELDIHRALFSESRSLPKCD